MAKMTGLLIRTADGSTYFIKGGIAGDKQQVDTGNKVFLVPDAELKAAESKAQQDALAAGHADAAQVGPFLAQIFNVELDTGTGGAAKVAGTATDSRH